ncbi:MAG TPA: hypothetical protein VG755_07925 [Nannocystaceae bacterium]|nr:hypothetical protein [Nannocystaceae bacterium]
MSEGVEYFVRATLEAHRGDQARRQMSRWAGGIAKAAGVLEGTGSKLDAWGGRLAGHTAMVATATASIAASTAAAAGAYGMGKLVTGSIAFNKELENAEMRTASVLQLFDKGKTNFAGNQVGVAEQFAANLVAGRQAIDELYRIAARSPASFVETRQMFDNMLPGAVAVGASMGQIYDLTKKSLALGTIMGGDFATTGNQLSRILTGGAGAEFEVWKTLQVPILEAGKAVGIFGEKMEANAKLTERFNQLGRDQRLYLVQQAVEKLGIVTESLGETWDGVTSTIGSNLQMVQREIGKTAFAAIKGRLGAAVTGGGAFDPEGNTQAKLVMAGQFIGSELGVAADHFAARLADATIYVADHWHEIGDTLARAFDTGLHVAELLMKFAAAKALLGTGMQVAGGALSAGGAFLDVTQKAGEGLAAVGASSAFALPAVLVLGSALAGVGVAFAGVSAYFVENWDRVVQGFIDGTIVLGPVLDAVDVLWAQLVAVGQAFTGTTDPAKTVNGLLLFITDALQFAGGAMVIFLQTAGAVSVGVQGLIGVFGGLYTAVLAVAAGLNQIIIDLLGSSVFGNIPGAAGLKESMEANQEALLGHMNDAAEFTKAQFDGESRFFDAATAAQQAIDNFDPSKGITADLRERLAAFRQEGELYGPELPPGMSGNLDAAKLSRGGHVTHIHNLRVHMDVRNKDPDRVAGVFLKKIERVSRHPVQASTALEGGM